MKTSLFALPGNETLARSLAQKLGAEEGRYSWRRFPDGESYVRVESPVKGRFIYLVASLKDPDREIMPLYFLASTLRDLGAQKLVLVSPYLAYLRQDRRFQEGEGVTSRYFATLLSGFLDGLVTVDPHLHRYASLSEIYTIPTKVVQASPKISEWIRTHVSRPLVIGPDRESEQWARAVAQGAGAPEVVLEKIRKGDREVEIRFPPLDPWSGHTPVVVDDIISSAGTMIETVTFLRKAGFASPICVGVHGIFAGNSYEDLLAAGAGRVITSNTISHPSNQIDLTDPLAQSLQGF